MVLKSVWLSERIKCEKYAKINQASCMCANYVKALESFPENDKTLTIVEQAIQALYCKLPNGCS